MRRIFVAAAAAALLACPAYADNTDTETVTVQGTIIASLELAVGTNITMPDLVVPDASSGSTTSVTLACGAAGTPTVTYAGNGGNPFADGVTAATAVGNGTPANSSNITPGNETGTCSSLTVTGESGFFYQAVFNNAVAPTTNGTGVTITPPTSCYSDNLAGALASGTAQVLTGGTDTLRCGATVTLADNATPGAYSGGSFDVVVTYD